MASRQDYRAMAQVIRDQHAAEVEAAQLRGMSMDGVFAIEALAFRIADMYAKENDRFKRDVFLRAAIGEPQAVTG